MTRAATPETAIPPLLQASVDPLVCPPDRIINWQTNALATAELVMVSHTHGVLGGYGEGSDSDRVIVGARTFNDLDHFDAYQQRSQGTYLDRLGEEDANSYQADLLEIRRGLHQGLTARLGGLAAEGRYDEFVPEIVRTHSIDLTPDGKDWAAVQRATRMSVSSSLRFALVTGLGRLFAGQSSKGGPAEVTINLFNESPAFGGQLTDVRFAEGELNWLELQTDKGERRIPIGIVQRIGLAE